ncbi:MAG: calcium-binding protein [Cyanobacteria bacterium P01_G01_bin.19]
MSELPVVSFDITPGVVAEDSDNPSFIFTITVEGDIPEEGIPTVWGGDFLDQPPGLFDNNIPVPFLPEGSIQPDSPVFDDDGNLIGFIINIFEPEITANPFIFDDIIEEEPIDLVYSLLPGEGYVVGQGDAEVTIIDGDSVIPGSGPTVSLSVSNTDLVEGEEFTVNFSVDGEIPEGGLPIFVDGDAASLSEFNIFGDNGIDPATDLVNIASFPEADGDAGGFLVTLTDNEASITLSVFDDGPNEGTEILPFELANGEEYEVAPDAGNISLTIDDGRTEGNDTLRGLDADDLIDGGAGADRITGNGGDDILAGGDGSDRITGNDGNDSIFGGADADLINGNAGDDLLSGDGGNDEIRGGDGDDLLMGVTGNDTLRGEAGSDTFVFGNGDGTDRINDFDPNEDLIGLVEGELTFADITLTQEGNNTILGVSGTGEELALLVKVSADAITEDSFVTVPDISNIDDVL